MDHDEAKGKIEALDRDIEEIEKQRDKEIEEILRSAATGRSRNSNESVTRC